MLYIMFGICENCEMMKIIRKHLKYLREKEMLIIGFISEPNYSLHTACKNLEISDKINKQKETIKMTRQMWKR